MDIEISPITPEITHQLSRLYPAQTPTTPTNPPTSGMHMLDNFFSSDFIPPTGKHQESYGVKYIRYLHQFTKQPQTSYVTKIINELTEPTFTQSIRERILTYCVLVQAEIEQSPELVDTRGRQLVEGFWKSKLPGCLWRSIQQHLFPTTAADEVKLDELEVAIELLYMFYSWALATRTDGKPPPAINTRSVQMVCLSVELFIRYSRYIQQKQQNVGKVQRIRLGHKSLMLMQVAWTLLVGDESCFMERITGQKQEERTGLVRDALRQIKLSSEKYPTLAADMKTEVGRLLPFVHPFDGHLNRTVHANKFGPIRLQRSSIKSKTDRQKGGSKLMGSPSTQMLLADMLARMEATFGGEQQQQQQQQQQPKTQIADMPSNLSPLSPEYMPGDDYFPLVEADFKPVDFDIPVPQATREVIQSYIDVARMTRSERDYAEWWHRLVAERGPPHSLSLNNSSSNNNGAPANEPSKTANDITINYYSRNQPNASGKVLGSTAQLYEYCGITEMEDLPGLETYLDSQQGEIKWPSYTEPESQKRRDGYDELYRSLFPLLPRLCRALILTISNWSPAEKELPARQFLLTVGPPQVSEATCLGIIKYPKTTANGGEAPSPLLGGTNVKRLPASSKPHKTVSAEVGARIMTQYAQWQAVGRLLMEMLLGLQANHVLQADYMAQLLMNENLIPAMFWWLGTANLDLCVQLPAAYRARTFMSQYLGARDQAVASWKPAMQGLGNCLRCLRRLTSHNGLRKGLLYKNKALYFYHRLFKVPDQSIRGVAAQLYRDIMPVVSRKQKQQTANLENISNVYLYAPASGSMTDTFWLSDFVLDPQIEMHRHVELLRLLHFYHYRQFKLRLPKDPALFPSLASQVIDPDDVYDVAVVPSSSDLEETLNAVF